MLSPSKSIIGLCTGLLPAAAVSSFSSSTSCIPLAVETVRIAFRLGLHVATVADRLRVKSHKEESWSVLVSGITEVAAKYAVKDFNDQTVSILSNPAP